MSRRLRLKIVLLGCVATVGLLKACGYIALPGGWIINTPAFSADPLPEEQLQQRITLPPGFSIETFADGLPNARMLLFTEAGDLLVSGPRQGKVWLIERPPAGSVRPGGQHVLLDDLSKPHGLAYANGWLYIAEGSAIARVRFDPQRRAVSGQPERIVTGLPSGGNHWTRTVHVGPDGKLYVTVGSTCNVCIEDDKRRAAMLRFNADGSGAEIYATGLRNAVDFAWQPGTGALYATDNGRDLLGDDFPPEELNRVVEGGFYGWPFANGNRVPDPDLGKGHESEIAASIPPAHGFGAHTAALGITFYQPPAGRGEATFPQRYHGAAFVAQHGSWNRSKKSGYQVVALFFRPDGTISEEPFATGFEIDEQVTGRPVDVAVGPDGALYVSDDLTGSVYRIAYGEPAAAAAAAPTPAPAQNPLAGLSRSEIEAASTRGAALWVTGGCAACHDRREAAPNAFRPLDALASKYTLDTLTAFLAAPQPPMPLFPFTDAQRRDLAVYLVTAHP